MRILAFDTETTGLPIWKEPSDSPGQPRVVELACELWDTDNQSEPLEAFCDLVNPGVTISDELVAIHGITNEMVEADGISPTVALDRFFHLLDQADLCVGHSIGFDVRMIRIESAQITGEKWECPTEKKFCTMYKSMGFVKAPRTDGRRGFKTPTLEEAMNHFWPHEQFTTVHRAGPDTVAARRLFFKLIELKPELMLITENA